MGQFLGGGLCLDRDTDSTACVLLVEIANHSTFPIFVWRPGSAAGERQGLATEVEQRAGVGGEGEGATEIPGGSRQCLSLEIPRLQVGPEEKVMVIGLRGEGSVDHAFCIFVREGP